MKAATLLSVLLAGTALAKTTSCTKKTSSTPVPTKQHGCSADNCARAVTGTNQGLASQSAHRAACSSFLECTAYPATVTVTATATTFPTTATVTVFPVTETDVITVTTVIINAPTVTQISTVIETVSDIISVTEPEIVETVTMVGQKRAAGLVTGSAPLLSSVVCPTAVPTYASACSGTARYSSACSCFGVTKTTTTMTTPTTTITTTIIGQTTVTASDTSIVTELVSATSSVPTTIVLSETVIDTITTVVTIQSTTVVTVSPPASTGNAYCENGQPVNGLSPSCTAVGCSSTNLRIEGASDTIYEGVILSGPRVITTPSGGSHECDGTNNGANPAPFANGISTIDAAATLCGFTYDGTFSTQFDDFFIQRIASTDQTGDEFWGILLNLAFTPAGGCETEVQPTDNLLWAFNAFNVNYFLQVQPINTPVVLAPGQATTFTVQGSDGNGNFANIAGAAFNGQTSDGNGNVPFTAPTTPGTYRYKATRSDSIRSNAVTVIVQG